MPAAELTPYALKCNARHNPIGIDTAHPMLSWKLKSDQRGDRQTAYEILVASSPEELTPEAANLWNSGRIENSNSISIAYAGTSLHSFQQCWWTVRVWSDSGHPSSWSQPVQWTMGLLDPADRKGTWIVPSSYALNAGPMPIFRKEFSIDHPLRRAILLISGLGFEETRINGTRVGDSVLNPAWTNYRYTAFYSSYEVTSLLKPGPNAIGVLLGNGFYNVVGGRYSKYTGSFGVPRLWAQLHFEFQDGSSTDASSDVSWRVHPGPITFSDTYGGEDFDARLEPSGWDRPGFDDASWPHAHYVEPGGGELRSDFSPPIRVHETFQPVRITQPKPGIFVYDLGQNFAGWPKIRVSGPAGASVRLTPGELLDKSGLVTQKSAGGGPTYFTYTLKGSGVETWVPRFTYYGFRYVQVEGAAAVHKLEGQFIYLDIEQAGTFECSSKLINRIHALILAAMKSNLQHVLTDCPHREKLGWLEQSYLMGPSLLYDWDFRTFLPKVIHDIRESQPLDGLIPGIAPEYVIFSDGFRDSPEWGSAGIFLPWLNDRYYGDQSTLAGAYETMSRYARYLWSKSSGGLLSYGLGDWYDIGPKPPGVSQLTPQGLTATATYYADLQILARAAKILGKDSEASYFEQLSTRVRDAYQKAFYRAGENTYATGSQTSLALPLALGLAPDSARSGLVQKLVDDIRRHGNHTTAGDIGYHYVIETLLNAGRSDVIYDMVTQTTPPSYAGQLAAGATALTEAWDADPRSSQNHLMLGHVEQWFYAGLAGIRPDLDSSGLTHVTIRPEPVGDLQWVKASWDTPHGPVTSAWHIEQHTFHLSVDIPPGMEAVVVLPDRRKSSVTSGRYEFEAPI